MIFKKIIRRKKKQQNNGEKHSIDQTSHTNENNQLSATKPIELYGEQLVEQITNGLNRNPDLQSREIRIQGKQLTLLFVKGSINEQTLNEDVIGKIQAIQGAITNEELNETVSVARSKTVNEIKEVCQSLLDGWVFVHIDGESEGLLYNLSQPQYRNLFQPMNESNVLGPKLEFTESLETNSQVLRQIIPNENLVMEPLTIGKRAPKEVRIVYMKGVAEEENINTFREKIQAVDVDSIEDSSILIQLIEEHEFSLFPQLLQSEQPHRLAYTLLNGKVGVLINGSPMAIIGPVTFFSFFESTEDLYFRWNLSLFLRLMRFVAMFISIIFTPTYVAALTYHYEIIPSALLVSIGLSRANVPFPPVMEALLLELLIELLREAGIRLPTKVGQTMGIVGGIVIGQAAVEAGFTSNILIMVVALSALASFTAPNYVMGTVIRIVRFPLIILAGMAGGIGLVFGLSLLLIHLLKITSLNRPYLEPVYPFHFQNFSQNILQLPHKYTVKRSSYNSPQDRDRKSKPRKRKKKDIDE
ncbi:spore germination protein [Bacillus sp. 165]|uniref:spore germination protein n=1 Tax=Bacillus sp. 165 TaxID=1529117 RepID=UPI001ADAD184|nr:spore germination protein [Bacillus sp. 165]MBO9129339.1 spore germination protein [Bacillus sp. 165]